MIQAPSGAASVSRKYPRQIPPTYLDQTMSPLAGLGSGIIFTIKRSLLTELDVTRSILPGSELFLRTPHWLAF